MSYTKKTEAPKTKRELEAAAHEAKAKAIRRAERAFWAEVEERLEEVKEKFPDKLTSDNSPKKPDIFETICQTYGVTTGEEKEALYKHLISVTQVNYYKRNISHHPNLPE